MDYLINIYKKIKEKKQDEFFISYFRKDFGEVLELLNKKHKEGIIFSNMNNEEKNKNYISILYFGESSKEMYKTLEKMKLAKNSSNISEMILNNFKETLKKSNDKQISLEQKIPSGKEKQLEFIVRKIVQIYSGKEINNMFYNSAF